MAAKLDRILMTDTLINAISVNVQTDAHASLLQEHFVSPLTPQGERSLPVMKCLLRRGVNVHAQFPTDHISETINMLHRCSGAPDSWGISLLEHAYLTGDPAYSVMVPFRHGSVRRLERDRICSAAKNGVAVLSQYINEATFHEDSMEKFLQLLLAELFLMFKSFSKDRQIDWQTATALINFGVDPVLALLGVDHVDEKLLLSYATAMIMPHGMNDDSVKCIARLLVSGARFDSYAIAEAVAYYGTGPMEFITKLGADVETFGARALAQAVRIGNFEAVTWLLEAGVDPKASIVPARGWGSNDTFTVFGASITLFPDGRAAISKRDLCSNLISISILRHLAIKGAPLRLMPDDVDCSLLFAAFWTAISPDLHQELLEFFLENGLKLDCPKVSEMLDISASEREWDSTMLLLDRRVSLGSMNNPAQLVLGEAPTALVSMISAGSLDLNRWDPKDIRSMTPLSAAAHNWNLPLLETLETAGARFGIPHAGIEIREACHRGAQTQDETKAQVEMVRYLLERTVVSRNEPAFAGALANCVINGNLELVLILVDSGVDVNSTDCYYRSYGLTSSDHPLWDKVMTFLDLAADNGFLDITKLFLNHGVLSHVQSTTPLDGAIALALRKDGIGSHIEVAKLIARFAISLGYSLQEEHQWLNS